MINSQKPKYQADSQSKAADFLDFVGNCQSEPGFFGAATKNAVFSGAKTAQLLNTYPVARLFQSVRQGHVHQIALDDENLAHPSIVMRLAI